VEERGDDGIADDDETWLFSVKTAMTTSDIAKMGFTNIILLDANRWRSEGEADLLTSAAAAAADVFYCFGMKEAIPSLSASHRQQLRDQLVCSFCGQQLLLPP